MKMTLEQKNSHDLRNWTTAGSLGRFGRIAIATVVLCVSPQASPVWAGGVPAS